MSKLLKPKLTGNKRHRVMVTGLFIKKQYLVLQYEVEGFVPEFVGGMVDGGIKTWWVDAKPEWELTRDKGND